MEVVLNYVLIRTTATTVHVMLVTSLQLEHLSAVHVGYVSVILLSLQ